jgi:TolB-like protein/class 3 adenylate cyclase/Tfp pilus assembly protein PilF
MESPRLKRRLTAILLADVVGYSRLMSNDEEETHARFSGHVNRLIEPKITEYGGHPVRSMGDGILAQFDSAVDAVRCAVEIQQGLVEGESVIPEARRIRLRIGINTGDVIVEDRDIYGNSVNIAARLEGLAGPDQIYVTRGVYDQLQGYPNLSFSDQGEHHVKNIERPIRIFRVESSGEPDLLSLRDRFAARWRMLRYLALHRPRSALGLAAMLLALATFVVSAVPIGHFSSLLPRSSIVVLPFRNLSDDPAQEYFADAVTDDLTTDLSRVPGAFVIARATAFTYKHRTVDARQVGREVGARYLLEGSIQKLGPKVQVNAQLIDSESGSAIWADRFNHEIKDLWELQTAITGRIAAAMDIQLVRAESRRASEERSVDPDATDLRLRAMGLYISGVTPEHTLAARRLLEEAVRLDPGSAESWGWLAHVLESDYLNHWNATGPEQLRQAETAVMRALAIDQSLALAHFANAMIHRAKGESQAALDAFTTAIKLNPNFSRANAQKGSELINVGLPKEAPPLVEKAIKLSPFDPSIGVFYWIIGRAHFFDDNYRDAIPWLRKSVQERPNLWYNWLYLVSAYALTGDKPAATKSLDEFHARFRDPRFTLALIDTYEKATPSENPVILAGRKNFHEGLLAAGMAER